MLKKMLAYLLWVFLGIIIIDFAYRCWCTDFFNKSSKIAGIYEKVYSVNNPYDVAIIGASRAEFHYQAKVIEDSLKLSVYNYGNSGRGVIQQYLAIDQAIKNGKLKYVIFDVTPSQLSNKWTRERLSDYYPLYWRNESVRSIVKENEGWRMDFLLFFSLFQYNSHFFNVLAFKLQHKSDSCDSNGSRHKKYSGNEINVSEHDINHENIIFNGGYSETAIKYFHKLIALCKENNVKIVGCLSPSLVTDTKDRIYIKKLFEKDNVECWDFSDFITNRRLYSDPSHLNERGSIIFTQAIINRMRDDMFPK